ncbi:hypothetical protein KR222_010506 [Zaprionus bogoriensis]|nr:hypothetical protein KR222_010506 [Zaprionus bogoriensis]
MLKSHFLRPLPAEQLFEDFSNWLIEQRENSARRSCTHGMTPSEPFDIFYKDFVTWLGPPQMSILAHLFWDKMSPCQVFDYVIESMRRNSSQESLQKTSLPRAPVQLGGFYTHDCEERYAKPSTGSPKRRTHTKVRRQANSRR